MATPPWASSVPVPLLLLIEPLVKASVPVVTTLLVLLKYTPPLLSMVRLASVNVAGTLKRMLLLPGWLPLKSTVPLLGLNVAVSPTAKVLLLPTTVSVPLGALKVPPLRVKKE